MNQSSMMKDIHIMFILGLSNWDKGLLCGHSYDKRGEVMENTKK